MSCPMIFIVLVKNRKNKQTRVNAHRYDELDTSQDDENRTLDNDDDEKT
jgi:hypothetical protein